MLHIQDDVELERTAKRNPLYDVREGHLWQPESSWPVESAGPQYPPSFASEIENVHPIGSQKKSVRSVDQIQSLHYLKDMTTGHLHKNRVECQPTQEGNLLVPAVSHEWSRLCTFGKPRYILPPFLALSLNR